MAHSKAHLAHVAKRRTKLIAMRRAGHDFETIARKLDYASRQAASKDLIRALEAHRDEEAAEVSVYRQQENERLDALLAAVWDDALTGDLRAIDTVLRLADRRAKLNGLDMPVRAEVTGAGGGALTIGPASLAQLHNLIGVAGDPDDTDGDGDGEGGEDDEATHGDPDTGQ